MTRKEAQEQQIKTIEQIKKREQQIKRFAREGLHVLLLHLHSRRIVTERLSQAKNIPLSTMSQTQPKKATSVFACEDPTSGEAVTIPNGCRV